MSAFPKFEKSVSCVCWAYNEKLLIEDFLVRINRLLAENVEDYEIVAIDDGSTDGTGEIIRALRKKIPEIHLITHEKNLNIGPSMKDAFQAAKKEFLFWQTTDWSYDIEKNFRAYLELLRKYDIVAGSRLAPIPDSEPWYRRWPKYFRIVSPGHLQNRSDDVSKGLISIINYLLLRIFFRVPLTDYQNVCFYRTKVMQSIDHETSSSLTNPEGLIKSYWKGVQIVEVPIDFIPRTLGEAKGTKFPALFAAVKNIFHFWWRWVVLGKREFTRPVRVKRLSEDELIVLKNSLKPQSPIPVS